MTCHLSTYSLFTEFPRPQDIEKWTHTEVLVAESRLDQGNVRTAIEEVFAAHPALGAVFEPTCDRWMYRPGGGWVWAVEPPGVAVPEAIARQRAGYDMRTGRLFAVSLLPGDPDRLVLTASHLCVDGPAWHSVVDDVIAAYPGGDLEVAADGHRRDGG
ncbi:hypothetical protein [Mycobacterium kubicae]|uniref:hypothetical protein n=1 Tax=Mycobacterium kubicae TaxID=120959 RepID=UPI001F614281|nr:hypothetical protein [Mycobacterium kubicae]